MKYEIGANDYTLDENGIVIDRDGGIMAFNDADELIRMWKFYKDEGPAKKITEMITDYGKFLIMEPTEIGPYVTDYQVWGESYEIIKEWEANNKDINTKENEQ